MAKTTTVQSGGNEKNRRGVVRFTDADSTASVPKTITEALLPLSADFLPAGYVGEDGVSEEAAKEPDPIKEMGGATVGQLLAEYEHIFTFSIIESDNANTLRLLNGDDNVTVGVGGITVRSNSSLPPERAFVLDVLDKSGKQIRIAIPRGQITVTGEIVYSAGEVIQYECQITSFPDDDGNNAYRHYIGAGTTDVISDPQV